MGKPQAGLLHRRVIAGLLLNKVVGAAPVSIRAFPGMTVCGIGDPLGETMATSIASAPGKLMLFGEHAVLYNQPCLVAAVNLRMQVRVELDNSDKIVIQTPLRDKPYVVSVSSDTNRSSLPKDISYVGVALRRFWDHTGIIFGGYIETSSQFTHSYGLGSSSAVTVATLKAVGRATGFELDRDMIFDLGYKTVLEVQEGAASGFDVAAATFGGVLFYIAGGKVLQKLDVSHLPLVVCYSGTKASTVKYVHMVARLGEENPGFLRNTMNAIGEIVIEAKQSLEMGDYPNLGLLMNENQQHLERLGVSTDRLNTLIQIAQSNGAYGAKLSGAGGGDCIIALSSSELTPAVSDALVMSGIEGARVLDVITGEEGVRIETEEG